MQQKKVADGNPENLGEKSGYTIACLVHMVYTYITMTSYIILLPILLLPLLVMLSLLLRHKLHVPSRLWLLVAGWMVVFVTTTQFTPSSTATTGMDNDASSSLAILNVPLDQEEALALAQRQYSLEELLKDMRPYQRTRLKTGENAPPLEIVVFSDPRCLFCQLFFAESLPHLRAHYPGTIWLTHRHTVPLRSTSGGLAALVECAGKMQGAEAYHRVAEYVHRTDADLETVTNAVAKLLEIDVELLMRCMIAQQTQVDILADNRIAAELKIFALPTWFASGKRFSGYLPPDGLRQLWEKTTD